MPAAVLDARAAAPAAPSARLAAYLLLTAALLAVFLSVRRKDWTELPLYLQAADRLRHGEPIYRHGERPWTYPALFALPFVPLLELPPAVREPLWHAANVAVLLLLVWLVERRVRALRAETAGRAPLWLFWGIVLLLAGRHLLTPLENQSHDLIVFLCVALAVDAWCADRDGAAGWWAGAGAALKATPLLFLPVFLWRRRFRAAGVLVVAAAVLLLLPDVLYPARDGVSWTVSWYREFLTAIRPGESALSPDAWDPWCQLNQSLAGTLRRLLTPLPPGRDPILNQTDVSFLAVGPWTLRLVTLAAQGGVLLWLLWLTRPTGEREGRAWRRFGQGAALVTAMVLLSPTSIKTHFCVLLLPVAFCAADFLYRRRDAVVAAALAVTFVLGTVTVKELLGKDVGNRVMASGSVTWCAVVLLLATGRVLLRSSDKVSGGREAPDAGTIRGLTPPARQAVAAHSGYSDVLR